MWNWAGTQPWSTHRLAVLAAGNAVGETHTKNIDGAAGRASKPLRDLLLRRLERQPFEMHVGGHLPPWDPRIATLVPAAVAPAIAATVAVAAATIAAAAAAAVAAAAAPAHLVHATIDRGLLLKHACFIGDEVRAIEDALGDRKSG